MADRQLVHESGDEMDVSSRSSEDSVPEDPSTLGSQGSPSAGQDSSDKQELHRIAERSCTSRGEEQETRVSPTKRSSQTHIESTSPKKSRSEQPPSPFREGEGTIGCSSEKEGLRKQGEISSGSELEEEEEDDDDDDDEEEEEEEEEEETAPRISRYASNARHLLFALMQSYMNCYKHKDLFKCFRDLSDSVFKSSDTRDLATLSNAIFFYSDQMDIKNDIYNLFREEERTLIKEVLNAHDCLFVIVLNSLYYTVSKGSLKFKEIMLWYKRFQRLYTSYAESLRSYDLQEEQKIWKYIKKINIYFLHMRNAFRELLMHIGENVDPSVVSRYERRYFREADFKEDIRFLKRCIQ